jgi:hypothetical protein
VICAVALVPTPSEACPGCQNPNLPMVRTGGVHLGTGEVKLGLAAATMPLWVRHEAGCPADAPADFAGCDAVPPQRRHVHDQFVLPADLRGTVDWGLLPWLGLEAAVPLRLVHTTIEYETPDGAPYIPLDEGIHHRDETLFGLGDPTVTARFTTTLLDAFWLVARLGSSLPLGETVEDPFAAGERGERHQHVQFGTGTFDPVLGLELARGFGRWQGAVYGHAQTALSENDEGFRAGSKLLGGLQIGHRPAERWVVHTSFEWFHEGPETWAGEVRQDGILGRDELLLGLGTAVSFGGPQYSLGVRLPVYRHIALGDTDEPGTLTAPVSVNLGVQWSLGR